MKSVFLFASMMVFFASGLALAQDKPVILTANVNFQQATSSSPSTGVGSAVFVLSADRTKVDYAVTFVGLTSPVRVAHLHGPASFGSSAGVKRDLCGTGTTPACAEGTLYTGTWSTTDMSQPLTETLIIDLLAGQIYVNVHTTMNGGGEIRGQVVPISPK